VKALPGFVFSWRLKPALVDYRGPGKKIAFKQGRRQEKRVYTATIFLLKTKNVSMSGSLIFHFVSPPSL
jgi:hypothetical protein